MLRRLLDRLGQWVKCEPSWAGMWDDDGSEDEPARICACGRYVPCRHCPQLDGSEQAAVTFLTGLTAAEIDDLGGLLEEPTALAYTPDDEIERGVEEFKALWPDKWDAWLRWCEAEET